MTAGPPFDGLSSSVSEATDDLVALTRDLIRIPTVNPPGDAYEECCDYLGNRLKSRGFEVSYSCGPKAPAAIPTPIRAPT